MSLKNEKETVRAMVTIYCKKMHREGGLCKSCESLLTYAIKRIDHCRFNPRKPACKDCPAHCYNPAMREKIREVMCIAGPGMMFRHPIKALLHLLQ